MNLLAALKNKNKLTATATLAIPATRKGENGGEIARIARIAVATETNQKNESANDVDFEAWIVPTLEDEHQSLATAIPATREPDQQADKYQLALAALAEHGWHGAGAEAVAAAIADGVTDPHVLEGLLTSGAVTHPFHS